MNPLTVEEIKAKLIPGVRVSNEKRIDVIQAVDSKRIVFKDQGIYNIEGIAMLIKETLWNIVKD